MQSIISWWGKWYRNWCGSVKIISADLCYLFLQRRYLRSQLRIVLQQGDVLFDQFRMSDAKIKYHTLKWQQRLGELPVFDFVAQFYSKVDDVFDSSHNGNGGCGALTPNDPKLSDGGAWRGSCVVKRSEGIRAREKGGSDETGSS